MSPRGALITRRFSGFDLSIMPVIYFRLAQSKALKKGGVLDWTLDAWIVPTLSSRLSLHGALKEQGGADTMHGLCLCFVPICPCIDPEKLKRIQNWN